MGIFVAITVILLWAGHLVYTLFFFTVDADSVMLYLHILLQAYLYTGLFITSHDSMHGSIHQNRKVNDAFGQLALWLFAAFPYRKMFRKHMQHHHHSASEQDPDFCVKTQNYVSWFFHFFFTYVTVLQILTMALLFNVLVYLLGAPITNVILFWVIPPFLATFQLFTFGTYLPHRLPHTAEMGKHRSRTQKRNHLWAMLSCWFFGYHLEHHEYPTTAWYRLYTKKDAAQKR